MSRDILLRFVQRLFYNMKEFLLEHFTFIGQIDKFLPAVDFIRCAHNQIALLQPVNETGDAGFTLAGSPRKFLLALTVALPEIGQKNPLFAGHIVSGFRKVTVKARADASSGTTYEIP